MNTERIAEPTLDWRTLDLAGKNAIEASAGTGKTYTLVLLVLRLLLERELPPSAILLATFTDAATLELRARVSERVRQAYFAALRPNDPKRVACGESAMASQDPLAQYLNARWLGDEGVGFDVLARQNKRAKPSVRLRDEKILERAMLQMDDMPIRTLHGLCRQLLSSFDLVPGDIDADIEDGDALTDAALDDAIRRRFTDVKALPEALLDALDQPFLKALSAGVKRVLNYGRISLRTPARVGMQRYRKARAVLFDPQFLKDLRDVLAQPKGEWQLLVGARRGIENLLRTLNRGAQRQLPKASLALFVQPQGAQYKMARRSILENPALAQLCQFAQLHDFALRGEFATLLNSLVVEVRLSRSAALAARGGVSFDSMIAQLAERLASQYANAAGEINDRAAVQLANAIHQRYPVALIDEFQDTDAQQWAILQAIYGTRGGLILVGDPKQSIYRFRGSDVHTFVRATKECDRFFLQHNYRASAPLVAALNYFYSAVARPFHSAEIAFRDAQVGRQDSALASMAPFDSWDRKKPLCFIEVFDPEKRYSASDACLRTACIDIKNLLQAHADQAYAQQSCAEQSDSEQSYADQVHTKQLQAKQAPSIALLVSSNRQVRTAQYYLREMGVHASASASLGVYQSQAAEVLQCVLCALAAPADLTRARAARLALQLDTLQLDTLDRVGELDERALFRWVESYLSQMLVRGIGYVCLSMAIEPVCADAQFVTDATHLAELLSAEEQALLDATPNLRQSSTDYAQAIWANLNAHMDQPDDDIDSTERCRIATGARVQVMTVHKAKGLEFDAVYLPTLCSAHASDSKIAIIPGTHGLECDAGSADFDSAIAIEADEALAELLRVQYVALTRGKEAVNVYFIDGNVKNKSALGWHLAQVKANQRVEPALDGAAEQAWGDQINAVPARVDDAALKAWRAGLELLIKQQNIGYLACEVTDFAPLNTVELPVANPDSKPIQLEPLPALRPPQRRISFSSMTQSEAKSDAAGIVPNELREPNFELAAEIATLESLGTLGSLGSLGTLAIDATLIEHISINAHPEILALETFRGPNFGLALHALFEGALVTASQLNIDQVTARLSEFGFTADAQSAHAIFALIARNCSVELVPNLNIAGLNATNSIAELGFQLPVRDLDYQALAELGPRFGLPPLFLPEQAFDRVNGMLIGFIDLVFQSGGKFYLLDYKSNWLGASLRDYAYAALDAAMAQHFYHLQHLLYALALHRYLRHSLPDYDYETHFGGAHYLFVRAFGLETPEVSGAGHYQYRAPLALIEALDGLFLGGIS